MATSLVGRTKDASDLTVNAPVVEVLLRDVLVIVPPLARASSELPRVTVTVPSESEPVVAVIFTVELEIVPVEVIDPADRVVDTLGVAIATGAGVGTGSIGTTTAVGPLILNAPKLMDPAFAVILKVDEVMWPVAVIEPVVAVMLIVVEARIAPTEIFPPDDVTVVAVGTLGMAACWFSAVAMVISLPAVIVPVWEIIDGIVILPPLEVAESVNAFLGSRLTATPTPATVPATMEPPVLVMEIPSVDEIVA